MNKLYTEWRRQDKSNQRRLIVVFISSFVGIVCIVLGFLVKDDWKSIWFNIGTGLIGAAILYALIDIWMRSRERHDLAIEKHKSDQLEAVGRLKAVMKTTSVNPHEVLQPIVTEMIAYDLFQKADLTGVWLSHIHFGDVNMSDAILNEAQLYGAMMWKANLQGAQMKDTNLEGAYLDEVNFRGAAFLTDNQLAKVHALHNSIMVDGSRYDGRYNLPRDLQSASDSWHLDNNNAEQMATFYGVSVEDYKQGQVWAKENLLKL